MSKADKNKLHILYANHARELVAFARQRVGGEEAADVVQDTYLRVLQYADQATVANPRAYLYRVASNVSADRGEAMKLGSARIEPEVDLDTLPSMACDQETVIAARQRLQRCLKALEELPEIYRHVFLLHRIDGMEQSEISVALDIPKRTVERYIAKALEQCLKRDGQET